MKKRAKIDRSRILVGLVVSVMLSLLVLGCGGIASAPEPAMDRAVISTVVVESEEAAWEAPAMPQGTAAPEFAKNSGGSAPVTERMIIRTGRIAMVVEDTRAARAAIEAMVARMAPEGAFIVSGDEYGGTEGAQPHISMSIRIPAAQFGQAMDQLADMALEVTNRNESAQDVTEEYVDLEARLESLEAARQRLLGIMEESRSTKDLLEAEQQLTQREAEIESIKGRMKYLSQSALLSSIWIELEPYILSQPVDDTWRPAETVRRAVQALLSGLRGFAEFLIFFVIAFLPWLVLIALVIGVVVWLVRRRARKSKQKDVTEDQASD
jgi:hypothetical protein